MKVKLQDKNPPLKIGFNYGGESAKKSVTVYVSQRVRDPCKGNCDAEYLNPSKIMIEGSKNAKSKKEAFDSDWVYLTIFSKFDCQIKVNATFKTVVAKAPGLKKMTTMGLDDQIFKMKESKRSGEEVLDNFDLGKGTMK